VPAATALGGGAVVLRPKSGPWKKLLEALVINLFWNGIVGVFIWVLAKEWQKGITSCSRSRSSRSSR
jgi:hypothetical protein